MKWTWECGVNMKFTTAQEMLEFIQDGNDLWSQSAETYVFVYNDAGSICVYSIDKEKAKQLASDAKEYDEYWSAFLGIGGSIYDDPSYENYTEDQMNNLDLCEELYLIEDWVLTQKKVKRLERVC